MNPSGRAVHSSRRLFLARLATTLTLGGASLLAACSSPAPAAGPTAPAAPATQAPSAPKPTTAPPVAAAPAQPTQAAAAPAQALAFGTNFSLNTLDPGRGV